MRSMFKWLPLIFLLTSCATKYIVPGNRFMTPETNGGMFKGQVELQQATANQLTINTANNRVDEGVLYQTVSRTGFMYATSFFDNFDLFWSHVGGGNSLLGAKFQIIGDPKAQKSQGHRLSLSAGFGGNEHETDDSAVEFKLEGSEFGLLYGYRLNEMVLPYLSLFKSKYTFTGKINGGRAELRGLQPRIDTNILALNGGLEFTVKSIVAKVEGSYQQLESTDTKERTQLIFGWTVGYAW